MFPAFVLANHPGLLSRAGNQSLRIEVRDMTLDTNNVPTTSSSYALNIGSNSCDNFRLTNVCIKELPGLPVEGCAQFSNARHVAIDGCTFIGGEIFFDDGSQVAISDCTFINNSHSIRSIGLRGESEFSVAHCTARDDYDPGLAGEGSFVSANSDFCTQSHIYIGENSTDLGPSANDNDGEQVLCEGGFTQDEGKPTAAATDTATNTSTVTFAKKPNIDGTTDTTGNLAWAAVIINGKGLGQHRLITGYNQAQTITVSPSWNVLPDSSSTVIVARAADKWVAYNNSFGGNISYAYNSSNPAATSPYSAQSAIAPEGGCYDWIGDSNTIGNMFTALYVGASAQQHPIASIQPCYFNYYANNTIGTSHEGLRASGASPAGDTQPGVAVLGTVFRDNTVTATIGAYDATNATASGLGLPLDMTVFEHNAFTITPDTVAPNQPGGTAGPEGFECDLGVASPLLVKNTVLYKNTFDGSMAPANSVGINFEHTGRLQVLRENSWTGFATAYTGTPPGAILEIPIRNFNLLGAASGGAQTANLTIWNSGTAPLNWTAAVASTSAWLTLSPGSGTVADQNSISTVTLTCNPAGLHPSTIHTGMVKVSGASQTMTVTVTFTVSQ